MEPQQATQPANVQTDKEIGYVTSVRDYLLTINGLPNVAINEIIVNQHGTKAVVVSLKPNRAQALLLEATTINPHETFLRTKQTLSLEVGEHLIGRVINPLGIALDGKGRFSKTVTKTLPLDRVAGGIKTRQFITDIFETGISTVDMLVPIAKGQRELVMGSSKSGKTGFLLDVIINQKSSSTTNSHTKSNQKICIYTLVGKPIAEIRRLIDIVDINLAFAYTVIIATSSSDPASLIYFTPAAGFTIAEYFQQQGKDVVLIIDDLGTHAKFYREIALLGEHAPSRESYPSDIFSIHAKLMERAGKFNDKYGGGSITALPVIETSYDDYSGYIPTNLMSMTDGHLMFNSTLRHQGLRPAIDIFLSVSRVGRQTQSFVQKRLADKVKTLLAQAKRLETLSRFGSEVSNQTQLTLTQSRQIKEILNQSTLNKIPIAASNIMLGLVFTDFLQKKDAAFIEKYKDRILQFLVNQLDLQLVDKKIQEMTNEEQFFEMLKKLTPTLETLCQDTVKGGI